MFYDSNPQSILRFGDVVRGFLLTHSHGYSPSSAKKPDAYQIEVAHPELVVILTPCCTIAEHRGNMLVVTPLRKIRPDLYFDNSYLREDFTCINCELTIQEAIGPEKWQKLSDEEKAQHLAQSPGKKYIILNEFIYEKHGLLPEYELIYRKKNKEAINYYMIDFRNIFRVQIPSDINPLSIKILQLSLQARKELREKLAHYFGRRPEEDSL